MTVTPGSQRTALNGATPVTVVPAPGAGVTRHVIGLRFSNIDTAAVTIILKRSVGGTSRQMDKRVGLAVDGVWIPADKMQPVIVSGTTHFLEAVMSGPAATTNPDAHAEWIDAS